MLLALAFLRHMKMVHFIGTFDPATGSITNHTVAEDIFCMGQAHASNGKVLCAGGTLSAILVEIRWNVERTCLCV